MRVARGIEIGAGLLASLWGIGALIWVLVGPTYTQVSGAPTGGPDHVSQASLLAQGIHTETVGFLGVCGVMLVIMGASACVDGFHHGESTARVLLVTSTVLLAMVSCVAILSFGWLLFPSVLLALIALASRFIERLAAAGDRGTNR